MEECMVRFVLTWMIAASLLCVLAAPIYAGEADVVFVELTGVQGGYYFDVTVKHADTGWEHFANWWRVRTKDGKEIARRVLAHPHVDEQQSPAAVPASSHCSPRSTVPSPQVPPEPALTPRTTSSTQIRFGSPTDSVRAMCSDASSAASRTRS